MRVSSPRWCVRGRRTLQAQTHKQIAAQAPYEGPSLSMGTLYSKSLPLFSGDVGHWQLSLSGGGSGGESSWSRIESPTIYCSVQLILDSESSVGEWGPGQGANFIDTFLKIDLIQVYRSLSTQCIKGLLCRIFKADKREIELWPCLGPRSREPCRRGSCSHPLICGGHIWSHAQGPGAALRNSVRDESSRNSGFWAGRGE